MHDAPERPANRLARETSPYLLQHAHNPVDWYPLGPGSAAARAQRAEAHLPLGRLLGLPLVPRDGARVLRERGDRAPDERALRQHQGRPRGAPRPRRDLHEGRAEPERPGRLADERVPDARARAVLRRDVLPAAQRLGPARLRRGAARALARVEGGPRPGRRAGPPPARAHRRGGPDRRPRGARRGHPRALARRAAAVLRSALGRLRGGAEVPACARSAPVPAARHAHRSGRARANWRC